MAEPPHSDHNRRVWRNRVADRHGNAVSAPGAAGLRASVGATGILVDGDRITETNCVRQPFSRSAVGLYKAVVLINRLNMFWGLVWESVPHFVHCGQDVPDSDFLISCVDTRAARAAIAKVVSLKSRRFAYSLDAGNLADRGQFVLGQPLRKDRKDRTKRLPCVHELFPSIVHAPAATSVLGKNDPVT